MAADTIDTVAEGLPRPVPASSTDHVPLIGSDEWSTWSQQGPRTRGRHRPAARARRTPALAPRVTHRRRAGDGRRTPRARRDPGRRRLPRPPRWSTPARHEGALHLDDVLARRLRVSIENEGRGTRVAEAAAALMGAELGWDDERHRRRGGSLVPARRGRTGRERRARRPHRRHRSPPRRRHARSARRLKPGVGQARGRTLAAMASTFGTLFRVTTFGESHGGGVGCGRRRLPPAARPHPRRPPARPRPSPAGGRAGSSPQRDETDTAEILSGVFGGHTTGTPIAVLVRNQDHNSGAYEHLRDVYRPSHADFTYDAKYGFRNWAGGGRASARETVGRVAAAAIARRLLAQVAGIEVPRVGRRDRRHRRRRRCLHRHPRGRGGRPHPVSRPRGRGCHGRGDRDGPPRRRLARRRGSLCGPPGTARPR